MPRGIPNRSLTTKSNLLRQNADLSKSYYYYHRQFTDGMEALMSIVNKIAIAKTKMDTINNLVQDAKHFAIEDKIKNKHQIQKLCPHCGEPKDPRGWHKHVVKCAREKKKLLTA